MVAKTTEKKAVCWGGLLGPWDWGGVRVDARFRSTCRELHAKAPYFATQLCIGLLMCVVVLGVALATKATKQAVGKRLLRSRACYAGGILDKWNVI
eukprot:2413545-Amphidinium_carterae.1